MLGLFIVLVSLVGMVGALSFDTLVYRPRKRVRDTLTRIGAYSVK